MIHTTGNCVHTQRSLKFEIKIKLTFQLIKKSKSDFTDVGKETF